MKAISIIIILSFSITLCNSGYTQQSGTNDSYNQNLGIIDKDIIYSTVTLLDKDGNYSSGFLIGLKNDTLVLLKKNHSLNIPIKDIITLTFEKRRKGGMRGLTIGGIMGTYLFYLIFWQSENEPFAYYDKDGPGGQALVSLLGTFLGGGIGYLIDINTEEKTEIFNFNGNDNDRNKEFQRLKNFLTKNEVSSKLHLNFQFSQVSTRLSEIKNKTNLYSYAYSNVTSFNLLRKFQLTYSIFDGLEIGGAVSWFGEPSVGWYPNINIPNGISYGEHIYEGTGFYAVMVYNPFHTIFSNTFAWKLGAGIGSGSVDYKFTAYTSPYSYELDTTIVSINKSLFSAIFFTQFDLFLYDTISLGLVADYIYLPEDIPGIPELEIGSRKLGNFSFGLILGLHF